MVLNKFILSPKGICDVLYTAPPELSVIGTPLVDVVLGFPVNKRRIDALSVDEDQGDGKYDEKFISKLTYGEFVLYGTKILFTACVLTDVLPEAGSIGGASSVLPSQSQVSQSGYVIIGNLIGGNLYCAKYINTPPINNHTTNHNPDIAASPIPAPISPVPKAILDAVADVRNC